MHWSIIYGFCVFHELWEFAAYDDSSSCCVFLPPSFFTKKPCVLFPGFFALLVTSNLFVYIIDQCCFLTSIFQFHLLLPVFAIPRILKKAALITLPSMIVIIILLGSRALALDLLSGLVSFCFPALFLFMCLATLLLDLLFFHILFDLYF